jgi:hypothetical protein
MMPLVPNRFSGATFSLAAVVPVMAIMMDLMVICELGKIK